jgi:hypothetical protein
MVPLGLQATQRGRERTNTKSGMYRVERNPPQPAQRHKGRKRQKVAACHSNDIILLTDTTEPVAGGLFRVWVQTNKCLLH